MQPGTSSPRLAGIAGPAARQRQQAFTLTEILISTSILGLMIAMTMGVFVAALKRANHTENALKGTAELRYAADTISQSVRSACLRPTLPTTSPAGLQLVVPPKDLVYVTVNDITWLDAAHTIQGSKSNQRVLKLSDLALPAVVTSAWSTSTRPSGAVTSSTFSNYFISTNTPSDTTFGDFFAVGDTLTIPATAYGAQTTGVINSISSNTSPKTVTLTNNIGVDVPDGTKIMASSGRRIMFEVVATTGVHKGELRYYPDNRDLTTYTILARDIDPQPLSDPSDATSARTVPFSIPTATPNYVIINLQKLPAATTTGRTLQGVRTTAFTRTDPTTQ